MLCICIWNNLSVQEVFDGLPIETLVNDFGFKPGHLEFVESYREKQVQTLSDDPFTLMLGYRYMLYDC